MTDKRIEFAPAGRDASIALKAAGDAINAKDTAVQVGLTLVDAVEQAQEFNDAIEPALQEIGTATQNAQTATENAVTATNNANEAAQDVETFTSQNRVLLLGNSFEDIDRPDLKESFILIDEDSRMFESGGTGGGEFISDAEFDRPDEPLAIIDKDGSEFFSAVRNNKRVLSIAEQESVNLVSASDFVKWFWEPNDQDPYTFVALGDPDQFNSDFDQIRLDKPSNLDYITKKLMGKSSVGDYDIFQWDFKPPKPIRKVIITSAIHGFEKYTPFLLLRFFDFMTKNWAKDPVLEFMRWNIHFVVMPLLNPWGFATNNRRCLETDPFNVSWTRSGNVVTVSFDPLDFPDTDGRLNADGYIGADMVDKAWVILSDSSDTSAVPNQGYVVKSVVGSYSYTVEGLDAGATSGTAKMVVSTDINRNFDVGNLWPGYVSNGPISNLVPTDNKGTKPFSLAETIYIRDMFAENEDAISAIDMHNGAGDYFTFFVSDLNYDRSVYDRVMERLRDFTDAPFGNFASNLPSLPNYAFSEKNIHSITPEWGGNENKTGEQFKDIVRYYMNLTMAYARFFNTKPR